MTGGGEIPITIKLNDLQAAILVSQLSANQQTYDNEDLSKLYKLVNELVTLISTKNHRTNKSKVLTIEQIDAYKTSVTNILSMYKTIKDVFDNIPEINNDIRLYLSLYTDEGYNDSFIFKQLDALEKKLKELIS